MQDIIPLMHELSNISRLIGVSHLIKLYASLKPIYEQQENWQKMIKERLQEEHPLSQSIIYTTLNIFTDKIGQKDLCIKTEKYMNLLKKYAGYKNLERRLKISEEFSNGGFFEIEAEAYLSNLLERFQIGDNLKFRNDCSGYWKGKLLNFEIKALREPSQNYHKITSRGNVLDMKYETFINSSRDKHIRNNIINASQQFPQDGYNFIVYVNSSRPSEPLTNFAAAIHNNNEFMFGRNLCGIIVYESAFNCPKPFISCSKIIRSQDYEAKEFAWINDFHLEFQNLLI